MSEDIKNMSKEKLLEYLEDISQQLDNIALDQIQIAIAELQFFKEQYKELKKENRKLYERTMIAEGNLKQVKDELREYIYDSTPNEKIREKIEELKEMKVEGEVFTTAVSFAIQVLQEILEGRK